MSHYQTCMIPVDNILKHLETAFNTEKMKAIFQQHLYQDQSVQIATCNIERIKYKPQKNCHVSYRLNLRNKHTKKYSDQLLCSRFYEQGGSTSRFLKEGGKDAGHNALLHIPELDCVTWIFPNDRKLNNLELITDTDFLFRQVAARLVSTVYGSDWSLQEFKSNMIRYVPEKNCSVRIQLKVEQDYREQQKHLVAYGKTCYNQSGLQVFRIMRQLWNSETRRKNGLNIPEPLFYQAKFRMIWQMGVPGTMLSELAEQPTLFLDSVANAARQIALLHQIPLKGCPCKNQHYEQQELQKVRQLLNKFNLPGREQISQFIARLAAYFSSKQQGQRAALHGDLHLKNILVDKNSVYLIDLDTISLGNPLLDIGSFIAAILNMKLIGSISGLLAEQTISVFLQEYSEAVPWTVSDSALRRYIAFALVVERIFRSFTRLKAGRMEVIVDLFKQVELILEDSTTTYWLKM